MIDDKHKSRMEKKISESTFLRAGIEPATLFNGTGLILDHVDCVSNPVYAKPLTIYNQAHIDNIISSVSLHIDTDLWPAVQWLKIPFSAI